MFDFNPNSYNFTYFDQPYNFGGMFCHFMTQVIHHYIKAEQYIVGIENKSLGSMQFMYSRILSCKQQNKMSYVYFCNKLAILKLM